jgi:hypothetical protein
LQDPRIQSWILDWSTERQRERRLLLGFSNPALSKSGFCENRPTTTSERERARETHQILFLSSTIMIMLVPQQGWFFLSKGSITKGV